MAKKYSKMSIEELEAIRDEQTGIINAAREVFHKAGRFLDAALQGQSVEKLTAVKEALEEQIKGLEDSDG